MVCKLNQPYYIPPTIRGIKLASSAGDANTINLFWYQAFPENNFDLAYNIYFSSQVDNVFIEGPKFVSQNFDDLTAAIVDLTPGDTYYFAVRATEYLPLWYNVGLFPLDGYGGLKIYPETLLLSDISSVSILIPITDIDSFPPYGVIQIGVELVRYDSVDIPNNNLIVAERGFLNTRVNGHTVDGYDGEYQRSPIIKFFAGSEEKNNFVIQEENKFSYNNYAYTSLDGYKDKTTDLLNSDLSNVEQNRIDSAIDGNYIDYHKNSIAEVLGGGCLDTYIGGSFYCNDGYNGVGMQIRNVPITQQVDQREEELLEATGEPVVLVKRLWKGIVCRCVEPNKETPENRCYNCLGTGIVGGYEQYYNPRRSDGRILVRFGPADEDLQRSDPGIENYLIADCWSLVVPILKDSDFIIRFNDDGSDEFRYELLNVTRNKLLFNQSGNQHFKAQRVRKTDPIYQFRSFRNTATMPMKLNTTVGLLRGPNGTSIPHVHTITVNEHITALSQINQTTGFTAGHTHSVSAGIILDELGHGHQIIL